MGIMKPSPYTVPKNLIEEILDDEKSDIWLLGFIVFQMLFGYRPLSNITQLFGIYKQVPIKIPRTNNPFLRELLSQMLKKEKEKRITWQELFEIKINSSGHIHAPASLCKKINVERAKYRERVILKGFVFQQLPTTIQKQDMK